MQKKVCACENMVLQTKYAQRELYEVLTWFSKVFFQQYQRIHLLPSISKDNISQVVKVTFYHCSQRYDLNVRITLEDKQHPKDTSDYV